MTPIRSIRFILFFCLSIIYPLYSQTISQKHQELSKGEYSDKSIESSLYDLNQKLKESKQKLIDLYSQANFYFQKNSSAESYQELLRKINETKSEILSLENKWRHLCTEESKKEEEKYALWDQEETTLSQLIMEYGATDYLYIIPQEVLHLKLNLHSGLLIPRECWSEMLEIILNHNGIGLKKVNQFARQLYIFKQDPASVSAVISEPNQLAFVDDNSRIFYLLSPPLEHVKHVFQFLERFADIKQTFIYQVSNKIAIVSSKEEVKKLLNLYQTIWAESKGKISKVISISKMSAKEMEKLLQTFFGDLSDRNKGAFMHQEPMPLSITTLQQTNSLILIGQSEDIFRAEKIIKETEEQLLDPSEMTVYIYNCRHSDPNDLSKVLEKVYNSLLVANPDPNKEILDVNYTTLNPSNRLPSSSPPEGYGYNPSLLVSPTPVQTPISTHIKMEENHFDHFIPDPKSGNLLMVVRRDALQKIKDLLKKLDVPKKMVQIEVLLFEKQLNTQNSFGLDFLKIGNRNTASYKGFGNSNQNTNQKSLVSGLFEFMIKGNKSSHFPAYEAIYNFLMTQEDIQLNAAPSVITVNQTAATISIVDEVSINNGAAPIQANQSIAYEKSYSRAQFGITIELTPTVHLPDKELLSDDTGFITLQTDISFDTPKSDTDSRPVVSRRRIQNEVRVADGETVIIGGLRKKSIQDIQERIPIIGEIPLIGKLFGGTRLSDMNTEMFFFITPTIILDPKDQLQLFKEKELKKRPGDIPEFLKKMTEAREKEKNKFMRNSCKILMHQP
ncbi:MAG: hypothetical protein ACOVOR_04595 [Rhabdochlamydiaceae bacterium]